MLAFSSTLKMAVLFKALSSVIETDEILHKNVV
jgi:hypothetical protein